VYNDEWLREHRLLEPERLTVRDVLDRKETAAPALVTVGRDTSVRDALSLITTWNISHLPVCDDAQCVGSISEGTLMARIIEDPSVMDRPVQGMMDGPFPVVEANTPMSGIGRMLNRHNPAVLVRHDGDLAGILTRFDMVTYLTQ
jgi:cystathionine beta-synthase